MTRNLSSRVEVVTPVTARAARERLWEILDVSLRDRRQAWEMTTDGRYVRCLPTADDLGPAAGTQVTLLEQVQAMVAADARARSIS